MFKIQISNPEILKIDDTLDLLEEEQTTLSLHEAIECIFPMETEDLILVWNHIYVPLSYKYDVAYLMRDFLYVMMFLENESRTEMSIYWPSDTFQSMWRLKKSGEQLEIESTWDQVIGGTKDLLNAASRNVLKKQEFVAEVGKMLLFVENALRKSNIDVSLIDDFQLLEICCRRI